MKDHQPKNTALYEDCLIYANIAVSSVALQIKRLNSGAQEVPGFDMQLFADFHFLITALTQLRNIASAVSKVSDIKTDIKAFDSKLLNLSNIRNVFEHIDKYRLGLGHNKEIDIHSTHTFVFMNNAIHYIGHKIDLDVAMEASEQLFHAIINNPPNEYSTMTE